MELSAGQLYLAFSEKRFQSVSFGNRDYVSPVGLYEIQKRSSFPWIGDLGDSEYVYVSRTNSTSEYFEFDNWAIGYSDRYEMFKIYLS